MRPVIKLTALEEINAIYFSLLTAGYDFAEADKSEEELRLIRRAKSKVLPHEVCEFFSHSRQSGCEVYPYWPRAALMEAALFFMCRNRGSGSFGFAGYSAYVKSLGNIDDYQRNELFFVWIKDFPRHLYQVLADEGFMETNAEISRWLARNKDQLMHRLNAPMKALRALYDKEKAELRPVEIILSPLKCAYSADYMRLEDALVVILGEMRPDSVVHECLHPIVRRHVHDNKSRIISCWQPDVSIIDRSYLLGGGSEGLLNAFEETVVCKITQRICSEAFDISICDMIESELA